MRNALSIAAMPSRQGTLAVAPRQESARSADYPRRCGYVAAPGQGILTILIGLMLLDFPGKRRLERRLVQQPSVWRALNWMRTKAHQPALEMPTAETPTPGEASNLVRMRSRWLVTWPPPGRGQNPTHINCTACLGCEKSIRFDGFRSLSLLLNPPTYAYSLCHSEKQMEKFLRPSKLETTQV